jgi:hypothetical protein
MIQAGVLFDAAEGKALSASAAPGASRLPRRMLPHPGAGSGCRALSNHRAAVMRPTTAAAKAASLSRWSTMAGI